MGSLRDVREPPHQNTMGIELECILTDDAWNVCNPGNFWQFWYFTTDGSIDVPRDSHSYGSELISQPLPYEALIKQIKRLHKKIGDWQHNKSCGIHIHVSRKMWREVRTFDLNRALCLMTDAELTVLFGRGRGRYNAPENKGKYASINREHIATWELRVFSSGDAEWACECVRRAYLLVNYKGEYNYQNICKLFDI